MSWRPPYNNNYAYRPESPRFNNEGSNSNNFFGPGAPRPVFNSCNQSFRDFNRTDLGYNVNSLNFNRNNLCYNPPPRHPHYQQHPSCMQPRPWHHVPDNHSTYSDASNKRQLPFNNHGKYKVSRVDPRAPPRNAKAGRNNIYNSAKKKKTGGSNKSKLNKIAKKMKYVDQKNEIRGSKIEFSDQLKADVIKIIENTKGNEKRRRKIKKELPQLKGVEFQGIFYQLFKDQFFAMDRTVKKNPERTIRLRCNQLMEIMHYTAIAKKTRAARAIAPEWYNVGELYLTEEQRLTIIGFLKERWVAAKFHKKLGRVILVLKGKDPSVILQCVWGIRYKEFIIVHKVTKMMKRGGIGSKGRQKVTQQMIELRENIGKNVQLPSEYSAGGEVSAQDDKTFDGLFQHAKTFDGVFQDTKKKSGDDDEGDADEGDADDYWDNSEEEEEDPDPDTPSP